MNKKNNMLMFLFAIISISFVVAIIWSGQNSNANNSSDDYYSTDATTEQTTISSEELDEVSFDFGGLYVQAYDYSISDRSDNKIVLEGNEWSPYIITIAKVKNKGTTRANYTYEYLDSIVSGLGSKNYDRNEYPLDLVRDTAVIYNLNDATDETTLGFIQHDKVLYAFTAKYNYDVIDTFSDEEDTEYGLEDFLDNVEYFDLSARE